jgi:hypothetical protein
MDNVLFSLSLSLCLSINTKFNSLFLTKDTLFVCKHPKLLIDKIHTIVTFMSLLFR